MATLREESLHHMSADPTRQPTTKEWREARAQALRVIIRKYADIAHEADMIVDEAIAESLPRFVDGSFAALVTQTAARRSIDRLRELATAKEGYDVLRVEAEAAFEATALRRDESTPALPEPERPDVTIGETRAATLAECQRRLAVAVGAGTPIDTIAPDEVRRCAAGILAVAAAFQGIAAAVDLAALMALSGGGETHEHRRRSYRYLDAHGTERVYGTTNAESAVLAILAGSWPKVRAGALPAEVIEVRANALRMATRKTS